MDSLADKLILQLYLCGCSSSHQPPRRPSARMKCRAARRILGRDLVSYMHFVSHLVAGCKAGSDESRVGRGVRGKEIVEDNGALVGRHRVHDVDVQDIAIPIVPASGAARDRKRPKSGWAGETIQRKRSECVIPTQVATTTPFGTITGKVTHTMHKPLARATIALAYIILGYWKT